MKSTLHWATMIACLAVSSGQLYTNGRHIVSNSGDKVRLKCVNWYGFHQELFVAGGLEQQSITAMTDKIASLGSNCVRIPFSIDMWRIDPQPPQFAVQNVTASECSPNATAMTLLDCVITHLTDRGIMVILNNHNSFPGWVGLTEAQQGLWDLPGYPVSMWLSCLEHMANRYKHNLLVVGMDIRNEIHDQDGITITWGRSDDTRTDWKSASSFADGVIEAVNPNMLIIVSGLCYGYDFDDMIRSPGPENAMTRHKLVYTSHVYISALWWTQLSWTWISVLATFLLFFGLILSARQYRWLKRIESPNATDWFLYLVSSVGPFMLFWVVLILAYYTILKHVGCNAYVEHLLVWAWYLMFMVVLSLVCTIYLKVLYETDPSRIWCFLFGLACCAHALGFIILAIISQTYWMVENELHAWTNMPVPLWIGEFGAMWNNDTPIWNHILDFIHNQNLDFAYWALNGAKWSSEKREYIEEPFGLLDMNYNKVRNPTLVSRLFR
jgi:aryl-phospho-beta-D-glucosidase BglC (GH1 family)